MFDELEEVKYLKEITDTLLDKSMKLNTVTI